MITAPNRTRTVRQALAATAATPSTSELDLLTRYVLGYLSLERANELLRAQGRLLRLPAETLVLAGRTAAPLPR